MQVRIAERKEVSIISSVLAKSWRSAYRGIVNSNYLNQLRDNHWVDFLIKGLNNGNIFIMVLEDKQNIMGAAILNQEEKRTTANLISFYLLPGKIGQGLGHYFYNEIETELRSRGILKCILDVLADNKRAVNFYEAHGYVDTNRNFVVDLGDCDYMCKVYEKNLVV